MTKMCVIAASVVAWSLAGGAFAQATTQEKPKETTQAAVRTDKAAKTGEAVTDATITTEVKARLMKDKVGRNASIDVDTKDGVVKISGSVPTASDVVRVGRLVETTKGVKSVVNDVTVARK